MQKLNYSVLFIKSSEPAVLQATSTVIQHLNHIEHPFALTTETAALLNDTTSTVTEMEALPSECDHIIVIGGDGSLLSAAKPAARQDIPVIGINLGTLGFLTDVCPTDLRALTDILSGHYLIEPRGLLEVSLSNQHADLALNDIVLSRHAARLLAYDVFIDEEFVCAQRADGLIVSTPTGSTAYALSAGGPIIHPQMQAISLVPLCPHRLNSRPIIVPATSVIDIYLTLEHSNADTLLSCDGFDLKCADVKQASIFQSKQTLKLLHPLNYNYFEALKSKLHWEHSTTLSNQ